MMKMKTWFWQKNRQKEKNIAQVNVQAQLRKAVQLGSKLLLTS